MRNIAFIFILAAFTKCFGQELISSNSFIQTCIKDHQCFSINNSSYLFYDESKSSFYLKVDFNKFKVGEDSLDDWLNDLTETFLYYKAPLDQSTFSGMANNNHKTVKVNGQIFLNGVWQEASTEISVYRTEGGLLNQNANQTQYDLYKVNFSITFLPKDFKVHKKPHHLKKSIMLGVTLGRINQLRPGQQTLLGEAYNH